jgi:hypothetical protein
LSVAPLALEFAEWLADKLKEEEKAAAASRLLFDVSPGSC